MPWGLYKGSSPGSESVPNGLQWVSISYSVLHLLHATRFRFMGKPKNGPSYQVFSSRPPRTSNMPATPVRI